MKRAAAAPLGSSRARASATLESRTQPRSTRFDLTSALPNEVGGVARGDRRQRLPNDPESLEYFHRLGPPIASRHSRLQQIDHLTRKRTVVDHCVCLELPVQLVWNVANVQCSHG